MEEKQGLRERLDDLKRLNRSRFDYVLTRSSTNSKQEAYTKIKKSESWYFQFTKAERAELEDLADELHYEKAIRAELILADAAPEAATVKVGGLRSRDQRIQQQAASEILDRTIGKPGENHKFEGTVTLIWQPHKPEPLAGES